MIPLLDLIDRLKALASEHEMDLVLVGTSITTSSDMIDQIDDFGRRHSVRVVTASAPIPHDPTLKIIPSGVPSRLLLEIDAQCRLVRHHNLNVTRDHAGKMVSENWLRRFIEACQPIAHQLIQEATTVSSAHRTATIPGHPGVRQAPVVLPEAIRSSKPCKCGGNNEHCHYCCGTGWT